MARPLRTFVALPCSEEIGTGFRDAGERLARLDEVFHAPRTAEFHLTLQFLGETGEEDLARIGRAMRAAAADTEPIEVEYPGIGAFPTVERARVVWAGVHEGAETGALAVLAQRLGEELGALGYHPEARAFRPHVTLGRLRGRPSPALVDALRAGAARPLGSEVLSDLKLILSAPGNRGYRYIDLTTVQLGSA